MTSSSGDVREAELRAFFDEAPIGQAVTALDGAWLRVNPALASMLGYSADELRSRSALSTTHPDDVAASQEAFRALLAGEDETLAFDKRFIARDGSAVWAHVTTRLQRDAAGKALQFLTYVVDITERKRADRALGESELRYRRLFESAKDGILILDADSGRIVDVNPFMTELTGCSRDRFVGKHLWEIGPFEDIAASKSSFAELQAQDYVRYDDLPLRAADGRTIAVEFVSNVYPVDGRRVIQCNVRDITVRKRAEQALRMRDRAIQAVSQGILIADAADDYPIVYASPGFARLTGYGPEEVLGRSCRFLQGAATDPVAIATMRDAIRERRPCEVELLNYRKDGSTFWNHVALSPLRDDDGQVRSFVGVQTDVTQRRSLESQFLQAQKMEAVGRLAAGVAHDFNNLLSAILGYAEMLVDDSTLTEAVRMDASEIRKAGWRATELTKQLLAFSRQQVLDPKVIDLNETVAGMEKLVGRLLGADIVLTVLAAPRLWYVKADPGQMDQILVNLVGNARDAMPDGGELTVETQNVELDADYARAHHGVKPGAYVMMAVTDTGIGMDAATQARIFEPFFTTKEQGKGTGLGLAMVFGIVKQSGGHVWVYSEPGQGTVFRVYLPRASGPVTGASMQPTGEFAHGTETILLVEDDDQVRALAQTVLRRCGYVVLVAPNGGEALLVCEKHGAKIHLLLTDVVLPRMSGRQLAERLAPLRPEMKVLFMSGYTDDTVLQHGVLESGVAYLQKPLTPASLTRKVWEALHAARDRTNA